MSDINVRSVNSSSPQSTDLAVNNTSSNLVESQPDVLSAVSQFRNYIVNANLNYDELMQEVRMMQFKIKPRIGSVFAMNLNSEEVVRCLWALGKLEEFVRTYKIPKGEERVFSRMVDGIKMHYQDRLNDAQLISTNQDSPFFSPILEMEIFRLNKGKKVN